MYRNVQSMTYVFVRAESMKNTMPRCITEKERGVAADVYATGIIIYDGIQKYNSLNCIARSVQRKVDAR